VAKTAETASLEEREGEETGTIGHTSEKMSTAMIPSVASFSPLPPMILTSVPYQKFSVDNSFTA
jgi:hypothetical protein